jgi:hypothetical protein
MTADAVSLGFAFLELSFDELAEWPVAIFAVSFWVAVVAEGNGLRPTKGFRDYVVLMGSGVFALKAFGHEREFTIGGWRCGKGIECFFWDGVCSDQIAVSTTNLFSSSSFSTLLY